MCAAATGCTGHTLKDVHTGVRQHACIVQQLAACAQNTRATAQFSAMMVLAQQHCVLTFKARRRAASELGTLSKAAVPVAPTPAVTVLCHNQALRTTGRCLHSFCE